MGPVAQPVHCPAVRGLSNCENLTPGRSRDARKQRLRGLYATLLAYFGGWDDHAERAECADFSGKTLDLQGGKPKREPKPSAAKFLASTASRNYYKDCPSC